MSNPPQLDTRQANLLAGYRSKILGSNAMLRALLEDAALKERDEGESAFNYIERLIQEDYARGADECLFPQVYQNEAKSLDKAEATQRLKNFVVLFKDVDSLPADPPLGFQCDAEDGDHAQEQCENAYPDCNVVWVWEGPKGIGVDPALQDYWGNQPAQSSNEQPTA